MSGWSDDLSAWLKPFLTRLGHPARRRMCPLYVAGLIGPGERKSLREHSKSWGADGVGLGSRLTGRGWAGAETGVAGEAGCGAAARGDDGNRGCPDRAR